MDSLIARLAESIRQELGGVSMRQDRLWLVTGDCFVAGVSEYNQEITGMSPLLRWMHQGTFHWFRQECDRMGWGLEEVDDR